MTQVLYKNSGPHKIESTILGSKSITYRALMLAAMADGVSELTGLYLDEGTRIFINALYQLGIVAQLDEVAGSCIVAGGNGHFPRKEAHLWCGNKTLITKFLLAACSSTPGIYYFDGTPALRGKSLANLLEVLIRQGIQIIPSDARHLPLGVMGADSLDGGEVLIREKDQSKIISALLIAAPFARSPFIIHKPNAISNSYVDMTCAMMAEFGVLVHRIHKGQLMVPVPQRYQARDYCIEPDFALAAYFFSAAALSGNEIILQKIKREQSKQMESIFLHLLENMGFSILENEQGVKLSPVNSYRGIEVTLPKFSDLFLALCMLAPFASTPSHIQHVGQLYAKEAERFKSIAVILKKIGTELEIGKNWLKIYPSTTHATELEHSSDLKILMASALLKIRLPQIVIPGLTFIEAEYPDFFKLLERFSESTNA